MMNLILHSTIRCLIETEIRAAKAGLDQFVYLFDEYSLDLDGCTFYNYIQYNFGAQVANKLRSSSKHHEVQHHW